MDAILMRVKRGNRAKNVRSANFDSRLRVPLRGTGQVADVKRGFVSLDANVRGAKFRFVNTHLEAYSAENRLAQARELTKAGGPARYRGQTFLVGDLNSERGDQNDATSFLVGSGFDDTFFRKTRRNVFTCCQQEDLKNTQSQLDSRIDFVLAKPRVKVVSSRVVGNNPSVRTPNGLWAPDHAGVVSKVRLRVKR